MRQAPDDRKEASSSRRTSASLVRARSNCGITKGAQNVPGNCESENLQLPARVAEVISQIEEHGTTILMHNDAVLARRPRAKRGVRLKPMDDGHYAHYPKLQYLWAQFFLGPSLWIRDFRPRHRLSIFVYK
jgi:hypothetical protein